MIKKNPNEFIYKDISKMIHQNDNFCVCALTKEPSTLCMCQEFRDQTTSGFCHCRRYYKINNYPVITLCGSTRFKDEFLKVQKQLTLEGWIVLSVGVFGHSGDAEGLTDYNKSKLDDIHKAKIEMSDAIYVINPGGYIGESTASEIEWAQDLGKEIFYLEEKGE